MSQKQTVKTEAAGFHDEEEHCRAIAELWMRFENIIQVNGMAYHDMAKSKAVQVGAEHPPYVLKTVEKDRKEAIREKLEGMGCLKLCES